MEKRLGVVGVIVEDLAVSDQVQAVLTDNSDIIVGRMGIPCKEKGVSVISVVVNGTNDEIGALTGKLGQIKCVSVKSLITKF